MGSSRKSSSGSPTSARAEGQPLLLAARQRAHVRARLLLEADEREHVLDLQATRVEAPEERQRLRSRAACRGTSFPAAGCRGARAAPARRRASGRRAPRPRRRPARPEAFEDLDGRRLARAVRAEQAEALARADLEVEAVDGGDVSVTFDQTAAAQRRSVFGRRNHDIDSLATQARSGQRRRPAIEWKRFPTEPAG